MELYCSFVGGETLGLIFQNEHREGNGRQRSRPSQVPSERISPEEQARVIEEQARIVGAQAGSNLEQVILQEAENETEARNLLGDPGRLQSFFLQENQNRHPLDTQAYDTYESRSRLREMLDTVKYDAAFIKRLVGVYMASNSVFTHDICVYAINNIPGSDEHFFQTVHDRYRGTPLGELALSRIHDQEYLRNIERTPTTEEFFKGIVDEFRNRQDKTDYRHYTSAREALINITDQAYLERIATGRNEDLELRFIAIAELDDRRVLQTFINVARRTLARPIETEETQLLQTDIQRAEADRQRAEADRQQRLGEAAVERINVLDRRAPL